MLCKNCSIKNICKLFGFLEENQLTNKIIIEKCLYFREGNGKDTKEDKKTTEKEQTDAEKGSKSQKINREDSHESRSSTTSDKSNFLIITHGDLDGIISAMALMNKEKMTNLKTVFTTPGDLRKVTKLVDLEKYSKIYVSDIAPNNKNPGLTRDFIKFLGEKLIAWYDHHSGWAGFRARYMSHDFDLFKNGFIIDEDALSCVELITDDEFLVNTARSADSGGTDFSNEIGYILNTAIKDNPRDYSIKYNVLKFLNLYQMEGDEAFNTGLFHSLKKHSEHYQFKINNTEHVVAAGEENGNTYVMKSFHDSIDFTHALMQSYGISPFAVIRTRRAVGNQCGACHTINPQLTPDGACGVCGSKLRDPNIQENMIIGTNTDINLMKIFELESGHPFRITIKGDNLDSVVSILNSINL